MTWPWQRQKRRRQREAHERNVTACRNVVINGLRDPRPNLIDVVQALDDLTELARKARA